MSSKAITENDLTNILNEVLPPQIDGYSLVDYGRLAFQTSGTLANGGTATIDITIPNYDSSCNYIVIPQTSNYGNVFGFSQTGATATLSVVNISGATHSVAGYVYYFALKK